MYILDIVTVLIAGVGVEGSAGSSHSSCETGSLGVQAPGFC